ncbi:MAG: glycosyltransferase family 2 protein [bacterium]|nr:glycosyltransferase family 2 protein [bacterium]
MNWPKISFIVCTYNCKNNAERCFTSIKKQKYPGEIELIASDGGSADGTVELLQNMGIKVFYNKEKYPEGKGRGKWLGYIHSSGDILIFIDSDNALVEDTWLMEMVKPLINDPYINFCICRMAVVKTDKAVNRYLSLIGTDPFVSYKSIDSLLALRKLKLIDRGDYWVYKITLDNFIITGGYYFTIWKKTLDIIGGYTHDTDVVYNLAKNNISTVAIPKNAHLHHLISDSIVQFTRKKFWWATVYFSIQKEGRDFTWMPTTKKEKIWLGMRTIKNLLFIPELLTGIKMWIIDKEPAWLLHPLMVFLTTGAYFSAYVKSTLNKKWL